METLCHVLWCDRQGPLMMSWDGDKSWHMLQSLGLVVRICSRPYFERSACFCFSSFLFPFCFWRKKGYIPTRRVRLGQPTTPSSSFNSQRRALSPWLGGSVHSCYYVVAAGKERYSVQFIMGAFYPNMYVYVQKIVIAPRHWKSALYCISRVFAFFFSSSEAINR